jgi:hypothetical protein
MKSRIELVLVALVCLGPVIGAYLLYYGGEPRELPRLVNTERTLLERPVALPPLPGRSAEGIVADAVAGSKWSLIYARTSPCGDGCFADLARIRQVHAALGRDQSRIRRVFVGPGGESQVGRDFEIVVAPYDGEPAVALFEAFESAGHAPGAEGRIYVADPHGNLVMSYPPDPDQEGLRDDLKRLLSVSRIG